MTPTHSTAGGRLIYAECFSGCADPQCPYTHSDTFIRDGDIGASSICAESMADYDKERDYYKRAALKTAGGE
jgi:hypothetical protein